MYVALLSFKLLFIFYCFADIRCWALLSLLFLLDCALLAILDIFLT